MANLVLVPSKVGWHLSLSTRASLSRAAQFRDARKPIKTTVRPSHEPLPLFSSLIHSFFYCREVSLSCHHLAIRVILVISSHTFIHYVSLEVADCTTSGPFALSPTQPQNVRCTLTPAFVASTVLCPFPSPLRSSPTASKGLSSFLTHIS